MSGCSRTSRAVPCTRTRWGLSKSTKSMPILDWPAMFPSRIEHAIAVEPRERERGFVDHLHEADGPALVGHGRISVRIDGREKEHVARTDEFALGIADAL